MDGLSPLERAVLDCTLEGEDADLRILRAQLERAGVRNRELTGVGFYCHFRVPHDVETLGAGHNVVLSHVDAEIDGLAHRAGFALFVTDGRLDFLEGFSYDEPWPLEVRGFKVHRSQAVELDQREP